MKIPLFCARNGAPPAVSHTKLPKTKGILSKDLHGGKKVHYVIYPRIFVIL